MDMARQVPRYSSQGHVYIAAVENTDMLIKNLSATGMCIESKGIMEVLPNERLAAEIIPEKDSDIGKFSVEIESRWIRAKKNLSESGFVIVIPPGTSGHNVLQQYLSYLDSRAEGEK